MKAIPLVALAALAPALSLVHAQDDPSAAVTPAHEGVPVLRVDDIELSHYVVKNVNSVDLYHLATTIVGREYHVVERGGIYSPTISNLSMLGSQIVIYDTPAYAKKVVTMLKELDVETNRNQTPVLEEFETVHLTPRYVSLETYTRALRPWQRKHRTGWNNMSEVEERRTLVVRDTPERILEMQDIVAGIDVPERQVLITCYLLRGRPGASAPGMAPEELTANLERLLPDLGFELLGFSMLQAGMASDRHVRLGIQSSEGGDFSLQFQPVAYDEATGSITARRCEVAGGNQVVLLSTDTVLRGNEYTVLGATGREPMFFVVHVRPWDDPSGARAERRNGR